MASPAIRPDFSSLNKEAIVPRAAQAATLLPCAELQPGIRTSLAGQHGAGHGQFDLRETF